MKHTASSRLVRTGSPAACLLATAIASLLALPSAHAATRTKATTGTDLTLAASWGTLPVSGDVAAWTSTSLGAGLTLPSALPATGSLSISVTGALSDIDITGLGTLGCSGMDLSASAVNMSIGSPIALGASQTWTVNSGKTLTASGIISGTGLGITKAGAGTLTLSNANLYSGATTVSRGTLLLDFNAAGAPADQIIKTGNSLVMAGGTLSIQGVASAVSNSQNLLMTNTSSTGASGIVVNNNGGSGTTTLALTATGLGTRGTANTVNIDLSQGLGGGGLNAITTTATAATLGWATVKDATGTGFATYTGTGVARLTGQTELATDSNAGATDFIITGAGTTLTHDAGNWSANSLTLDTSAGTATLDIGTGITTLTKLGVLSTGSNNATIQNGQLGAAATEVIVHTMGAGTLTVSGTVSSGAGSLTKSGAGTLTLAGANNYSGGTIVNQGTLQIGGGSSLGSVNGTLTITGGTLDLNGNDLGAGNFTGTGGTIVNNSTGTNKTLTIGNNNGTGGTYAGVIADHTSGTGTLALAKVGTGTLTLSGLNTYSGKTVINAGTVNVNSLANVGGGASALGAPTTVANGTIDLYNGATLQHTGGVNNPTTDRVITLPAAAAL